MEKLIGQGGFCDVYDCGNGYVRKVLRDTSSDSKSRFKYEIEAIQKFSHEYIVKITNYQINDAKNKFWYEMKKYNFNLTTFLTANSTNASDYSEFFSIMFGIINGLGEIHKHNIYHRDIKPENILLDNSKSVVISDFGLAMDLNRYNRLTRTNQAMGTDFFIAPEQLQDSKHIDQRADIYSFGQLIYWYFKQTYDYIKNYDGIDPNIKYIIKKATNQDVSRRFQNVNDLKNVLLDVQTRLLDTHERSFEIVLGEFEMNSNETIIHDLNILLAEMDEIEFRNKFQKINKNIFIFWNKNLPDTFESVLDRYLDLVSDGIYSWAEIDGIADLLMIIYKFSTLSNNSKLNILEKLIDFGNEYNRFHVMRLCFQAISLIEGDEDLKTLIRFEASKSSKSCLSNFKDIINYDVSKLPNEIRSLFSL